MARKSVSRIKLGLFVIVSLCGLLGSILWLTGSRFLRPMDHYHILFSESVSGLLPGARVEYEGVTVGRVEELMLTSEAPPRVMVSISVRPGTPVRQNTTAVLVGPFITNILFVQLQGGTGDSPLLDESGTIKALPRPLDQIQDQAAVISKSVARTMDHINKDILSPQNLAAVQLMLKSVAQLSAKLTETADDLSTPQNRAMFKQLVATLTQAASGVKAVTDSINSLRGDARGTLVELHKTAASATQLVAEISQLTRRLDAMVAQNQSELHQLISNLTDASAELGAASAQIRRDPSQLLWGNRRPEREIPDK